MESGQQFPCVPVPFQENGPYAIRLQELDSNQQMIWIDSCNASAVTHKMAGWDRLYYNCGVRQPALLVHRGWASIVLYDEPNGLDLLQEAQSQVGLGSDIIFDAHVVRVKEYVESLEADHDNVWDTLEDPENEVWYGKWIPFRPMPQTKKFSPQVGGLIQSVMDSWSDLASILSPDEAVTRYNRLLSLQTNQLEGLFLLYGTSISRLVRIGFFPPAVNVLKEGSLYFEFPDEASSKVARVCEDMLKAIVLVHSMTKGYLPIDASSVKRVHFDCTFSSRFIRADPGPPPIYAIIPPGKFRRSICSTVQQVGPKTGIVQYASFRKIEEQIDGVLGCFSEYLKSLNPQHLDDALLIAAWSHVWLAKIHPFGDGNGRVSRLISSIPLLKAGFPPINIMGSQTLDAAKKGYVDALVKGIYDDDFEPLVVVILNGMLESIKYIKVNCVKELEDDDEYKNSGENGKTKLRLLRRPRAPWNDFCSSQL